MKISRLAIAGAATALVASAVIAPSAAFASSSISASQSTVCPGESITLTTNGVSDGTVLPLTAPEYSIQVTSGNPTPASLMTVAFTGPVPYAVFALYVGQTYSFKIVTASDENNPASITSVVSSADIQVLAECAAPAPEPEAEALPNTGASAGTMTALALGAAVLGLGGAVLARRARRATASK